MSSSSNVRAQVAETLRETLAQLPASSIQLQRDLVCIPSSLPTIEAFKILSESKLLSAPVYEKCSSNFVGFLDTRDLLSFCVFAYDDKNLIPSLEDIINVGTKRVAVAISSVTPSYLARRHPFHVVSEDDSLAVVASKLAAKHVHRVPVVDSKGDLSSIITQSAIVKYLFESKGEMKEAMAHTVSELAIGSSPVVTISKNSTAADTFDLMDKKGLSGIGIVDDEGRLIANTSASDIKLFLESMESLALPIVEFLRRIHKDDTDIHTPLVCATPSATLGGIIGMMTVAHVHRVFIVDGKSMPVSVVSVTDIMKLIAFTNTK